jgi:hypothetical protein
VPSLLEALESFANDPRLGLGVPPEAIPRILGTLRTIEVVLQTRQRHESAAVEPAVARPRDDDAWLTADEVAKLLKKTRTWVYRQAKQWAFAKRPTKKSLLISQNGLRRWMDRH